MFKYSNMYCSHCLWIHSTRVKLIKEIQSCPGQHSLLVVWTMKLQIEGSQDQTENWNVDVENAGSILNMEKYRELFAKCPGSFSSKNPRMIGTNSLPIQRDCAAACHDSLKQNMASVSPFSRCHRVWGEKSVLPFSVKAIFDLLGAPKVGKVQKEAGVLVLQACLVVRVLLSSCRFSGRCAN